MPRKGKLEMLVNLKNKDVILPFEIAWAKQPEMSIHEQRVLLRVMEYINYEIKGIRISDNLRQIEPTEVTYEITMPTSDVFFRDMTPKEMEEELLCLSRRFFQVRDKVEKIWWACGYIEHPKVHYGTGKMSFGVYKPFWKVLLNFVGGFREIELTKALLLPTTYSLRFYMLVSGKTEPLYLSVEDFKDWMGIEDKLYRDKNGKHRIDNLVNRVINPAKKALDETCPYTFTYEKVRENPHSKRSTVIGFRFYSVYQPKFRDPDLERSSLVSKISPRSLMGADVNNYLKINFDYTKEALKAHNIIIHDWQKLEKDPIGWLAQRRRAAHEAEHGPIAYICGAIKKRTKELEAQLRSTSTAPTPMDQSVSITQSTSEPTAAHQATQPRLFDLDDLTNGLADNLRFK